MVTVDILGKRKVPIFMAKCGNMWLNVLFDTGANLAVINGSNRLLNDILKSGVREYKVFTKVSTINSSMSGEVYLLRELEIADITIHNLCVVKSDLNRFGVDLILPAYVLKNNSFAISYSSGRMVIDNDVKDIYVTAMIDNSKNFKSYSVFANELEWIENGGVIVQED